MIQKTFLFSLVILQSISVSAETLSDTEWQEYFSPRSEDQKYKIEMTTPFGQSMTFYQIRKVKGIEKVDGKSYHRELVLHDSGPFASKRSDVYVRTAEDGYFERAGTSDRLLVPRPLNSGQTWKSGDETLTFDGVENVDLFSGNISSCAKVSSRDSNSTGIRCYERGVGLVYKSVQYNGSAGAMLLVHEKYAGN